MSEQSFAKAMAEALATQEEELERALADQRRALAVQKEEMERAALIAEENYRDALGNAEMWESIASEKYKVMVEAQRKYDEFLTMKFATE